ncbi:branched-chain amino acid transaminase [Parvicella tangerina]|uniref:Branched-chain-amino-acid aminotransferase n=1 Tax=Parvicella tangerina TaxID=2829795 RepID=A0A916JKD8_9FLAO|nr:branched-chain amino acid transaminase [Parvicella tangerina]CAG5077402.1 Branched-chain-amino-acid aminotransferase [Parvicella tangerina]
MYYNEKSTVYLNGYWLPVKEAQTNLYSQTLHYGSGVFEGIRSYATEDGVRIFKAKEHFERLKYSAEKMHIKLDLSVEELTQLSYELLERNNLTNAYLRPLVYLGENMSLQPTEEVNVFLCTWEWGKYLGDDLLKVMTSSYQRPNPKSCHVEAKVVGHYTNSILATTEAKQKGFDEALLLDMNENVAEGPGANFFYEKDEVLYTAPLGNILPGITRQTIFELAEKLEYEVVEKFFTPEEVYNADGAFFTGTAAEVAGIDSLDNHKFKLEWEDTMGCQLARAYRRRVCQNEYQQFDLV